MDNSRLQTQIEEDRAGVWPAEHDVKHVGDVLTQRAEARSKDSTERRPAT